MSVVPDRIYRYVTHDRVNDYAALGWVHEPGLEDTHHAHYAITMRWMGEGEPREPVLVLSQRNRKAAMSRRRNDPVRRQAEALAEIKRIIIENRNNIDAAARAIVNRWVDL